MNSENKRIKRSTLFGGSYFFVNIPTVIYKINKKPAKGESDQLNPRTEGSLQTSCSI